jgi:hypothetical protein
MRKRNIFALAALLVMAPALSWAEQFAIVGPRALGMGGASVAAVNDSTAVYWNPAALAQYHRVDIRVPVEAGLKDHMDLKDNWNRINDIYNQAVAGDLGSINELIKLIRDLDKPDTGADGDLSTGFSASVPLPHAAIAVSALNLGYAGLYPTADTANLNTNIGQPDFVGNNDTTLTGIGINTVQPALSFALSLGGKVFLGANAKMIYASTYVHSEAVGTSNFDDFLDRLDNSKTRSNEASLDAGIIVAPSERFSIGVVGRDLTSPSFPVQGVYALKSSPVPPSDVTTQYMVKEIELKPQVRAGIAWQPFQTFTLAADYDLTKNETFTPGYEDQTLALGLEKTFWSEYLSCRLGAYRNLADDEANTVYTAGLGTRILAFRLDLAGAYDFDEREYQASMNLALRF